MVRIKVKRLVEGARLPRYAHVGEFGDLAADVYASAGVVLARAGSTVVELCAAGRASRISPGRVFAITGRSARPSR